MVNTKVHYRSAFTMGKSAIASDESLFRIVLFQIGKWIQTHLSDTPQSKYIFKKWFYCGGKLNSQKQSTIVEVQVLPFADQSELPRIWVLKFQHKDSAHPARIWTAFFAIEFLNESMAEISITVTWHLFPGYVGVEPPLPKFSVPRIVKQLLEYDELAIKVGGQRIEADAKKLEVGQGRDLYQKIISNDRSLPIILINIKDWPDIIKPGVLQSLLLGSALVYWYNDPSVHQELYYDWGKQAENFQCIPDSLRIYQLQVNISDANDSKRHRFFSLTDFVNNPETLMSLLVESVLRITGSRLGRGGVQDFDSLDLILQGEKLQQLRQAASSVERSTEESAYIEALEEESYKFGRQVSELKTELDRYVEYQILYEESQNQLEVLKDQFSDISKNQKHLSELGKAQEELRDLLLKYPETLEDALSIISKLNKDRLVVLEDAFDSAKESDFDDLSSAWELLMAMSTTLYDILFKGDEGNVEKSFKDRTNFDLSMKDSKLLKENAKMMALRRKEYDGKTIEIIPHTKCDSKGKHLRIHFYIDSQRKLLVIGHCGDHLETPGTKRRKD